MEQVIARDLPAVPGSAERAPASPSGRFRRILSRKLVPGFVTSLYYYAKHRCLVHPRAMVQLSSRISFGRKTTVQPYSRIIVRAGRVTIGGECSLQSFSTIAAGDGEVRVGNHVRIGSNCNVLGTDHQYADADVPVHHQRMISKGLSIEDDVWIGANCVILPGLHIGRGAIIGAGSVVTKDVPPFTVVVGNPARPIKSRRPRRA